MGLWSPALFASDLACDIRTDYGILLSMGKTDQEAEEMMIQYHRDLFETNTPDEQEFWIALAVCEWKRGRLSQQVKTIALHYLEQGWDLPLWEIPGKEKDYRKRKKVIEELVEKLNSPMPPRKEAKKVSVVRCPWPVGSLLAYHIITNEEAAGRDPLFGKYALLRIIQINRTPVTRMIPDAPCDESMLVGLYGWCGDEIPNSSIIKELEFIPLLEAEHHLPSPPEPLDFSVFEAFPEEFKNEMIKMVQGLYNPRIETCTCLDWRRSRKDPPFLTYLDCDPSFQKEVPGYFKTKETEYCLTNPYAFDLRLIKILKPYYCPEEKR